jgi:glutamate formiminotransferase / 5-formyltetrahydrofolate cyclo-ligase
MAPPILMAVPNVSEGRERTTIAAIGAAFAEGAPNGARLLDVHSDGDHHRSVFTIAAHQGELAQALLRGARVAVERIDVMSRAPGDPARRGQHPHVGAVDVVPIVYLDPGARGAACAEALVVGDLIGEELHVPVFLYGELSGSAPGSAGAPGAAGDPGSPRTRAQLRRGGVSALAERMAASGGEDGAALAPDFGPARMHPRAGATLLAARPPLVAFNLQLAPSARVSDARAIAALIREDGPSGLPGVRALGIELSGGVAQISMNVERPFELSLAMVVAAVRAHAEIAGAELVGLAPAVALEDFPHDVPIAGFDPARHLIENALGSQSWLRQSASVRPSTVATPPG